MRTSAISFQSNLSVSTAALVVLAAIISIAPLKARAQFFTGPIASSTGGAGRAAADGSEAAFLNPASVVSLRKYYMSGIYGTSSHPVNGDQSTYGVSLADGTPENLFPASLSYIHRFVQGQNDFTDVQQDLQVAVGASLLPRLGLGIAGHQTTDLLNTGSRFTQTNMNVGLLFTPVDYVGLAATVTDVFTPSESVAQAQQVVPTYAIGGHLIIQNSFRFRLDFVRPDRGNERTDVMSGIETYFTPSFAFRVGEMWKETLDQNFFTAGLGYHGPNLSFDYSYQRDTRAGAGETHLIDLWVGF